MGTLYLVRHGQASFGADDYDVLSPLGHSQAERLGEYFKGKGVEFEAAYTGTLKRQISTLEGITRGMNAQPSHILWPGLNEYDSLALIAAVHPHKLEKPDSPELYREHFRLLKSGLSAWMAGSTQPVGMPSYAEFTRGVVSALDHVRSQHTGKVLLVSSGGPISTAVGQVLRTPFESVIELNMRLRNASVTEFVFNPKQHSLVSFNSVTHFDAPEHASWHTHA
jgi:broad specificity phosphatase PhoE